MRTGKFIRLGLDFDNTIVSYDDLFGRVAIEKGWIESCAAGGKIAVRDWLRAEGREEDWTRLQGEVYGRRILEAGPYPGMMDALKAVAGHGVHPCIISHKTRTPYLGVPCDLHAAGRDWLDHHGFHNVAVLGWARDQIFFELTKQAKVDRIVDERCTHYVDDLPEILDMLPGDVQKIHFAPDGVGVGAHAARSDWQMMRQWSELPALLGFS